MERYAKWSIAAAISWVLFFVVLFTGIVRKTSVFREYGCQVEDFSVDPRFDCYKRCSIMDNVEIMKPATAKDAPYEYLSADDVIEVMEELEREDVSVSEEELVALFETVEYMKNKNGNRGRGNKGGNRNDKDGNRRDTYAHCDVLEHDTLETYFPRLCLNARFGLEDPLCPPENAPCYIGEKLASQVRTLMSLSLQYHREIEC